MLTGNERKPPRVLSPTMAAEGRGVGPAGSSSEGSTRHRSAVVECCPVDWCVVGCAVLFSAVDCSVLAWGRWLQASMLPTAGVCANALHLPEFDDQAAMVERIRYALKYGGVGFGMH